MEPSWPAIHGWRINLLHVTPVECEHIAAMNPTWRPTFITHTVCAILVPIIAVQYLKHTDMFTHTKTSKHAHIMQCTGTWLYLDTIHTHKPICAHLQTLTTHVYVIPQTGMHTQASILQTWSHSVAHNVQTRLHTHKKKVHRNTAVHYLLVALVQTAVPFETTSVG